MEERPICVVKDCKNLAIVLYNSKFVCGECCIKFSNEKNNQFWKENGK